MCEWRPHRTCRCKNSVDLTGWLGLLRLRSYSVSVRVLRHDLMRDPEDCKWIPQVNMVSLEQEGGRKSSA